MLFSLKFKTVLVVVILAAIALFSFVGNSNAREILDLSPHNGGAYDAHGFGEGAYHRATVKTDDPFYCVWWYIDGKYSGWSDGSNTKTQTSFTFSRILGSVNGTEYVIKSEVGWLDDNGNSVIVSDSYTITVYEPFQIMVMRPEVWCYNPVGTDSYEDYQVFDYLAHEAYVVTSEPYHKVDWYVSTEGEESTEPVHTTFGDGDKIYASFNPYVLSGSLEGTEYIIKAVAWYVHDDVSHFVTKTYKLKVYKPVFANNNGMGKHNVEGYAELSRQFYNHPYVDMDCYVYAYNPGNENGFMRKVYHKFVHEVTRPDGTVRAPDDATAATDLPVGGSYSDFSTGLSVHVGHGSEDDDIVSISYVRLVVTGDIMVTLPSGREVRRRDAEDSWYITNTVVFKYPTN